MNTEKSGLALQNLTHCYGGHAVVKDVSLEIAPGELVCLLGPSGCGKTTTLRMAAGLEAARHGRILLNGRLVSGDGIHLPPEDRHVGFLFQDYALFPHLDVLGNVEFGLSNQPRPRRRERALAMLEQVGMSAYAHAWPHQLSGGQQQRIGLARALAPEPRLMLLDEPFSGLDKRLRDQIRDETLHVLKTTRVATLMVTHDPEEAMFMADRIAIMRGGRIVQMDSPAALYDHPADSFVASFFGEVNVFAATAADGMVTTPLGKFPAPALRAGDAAEVLVRPEAITLTPDPHGTACVTTARLLGRICLAHVRVETPGHPAASVHARLERRLMPVEGERVNLSVDPAQVFIFPAPAPMC